MEINFTQILFQVVNFGLILYILNKYLYKPIRKVLQDRADKVNNGLKAAEKNLKEQEQIETLKKKELAKARAKALKIIADAKKDAQVQADKITQRAKTQAQKESESLLAAAKANAKMSEAQMAATLKELTLATTKKLLGETLSSKQISAITAAMVKKLK